MKALQENSLIYAIVRAKRNKPYNNQMEENSLSKTENPKDIQMAETVASRSQNLSPKLRVHVLPTWYGVIILFNGIVMVLDPTLQN